ncbi:MAG: threonine--tRNA ligase [Mycobacteriales bacterium]
MTTSVGDVAGDVAPSVVDRLVRIRHSSAHILAQAVREHFGELGPVHLGVGPATAEGFYYDFELPRPATEADLAQIESRMKEIIREGVEFHRRELTPTEARELFKGEPFKIELIDGILNGSIDEDAGSGGAVRHDPELSAYQHSTFVDLCKGPHVATSRDIDPDAVKLLSVAGAYWRGDERRPMLQRIYGTAWENSDDLKQHLWRIEEAEKRDHRRLGRELELFHLEPTAPGMPYWLPNGMKLLNNLLEFWREEHEQRGYQEVSSPLINEKSLWETSGHWGHYRDNMFVIPVSENVTYGVKPMNCPNAMVLYRLKSRSYRDLPLRLSDCDILHRHERSGTLHGLLRVQKFMQDDAHVFLEPDQIRDEYERIFDICDRFYSIFQLEYRLRLGTRPDDFVGEVETWNRAERELREILERRVGAGNYLVEEGGGAFYGPKIDIMMYDALGRGWQMGTIQLDFQLPARFECTYTDRDGSRKTPVVVHRVIYGSLERFIGILIEHTAGRFPLWISPVQMIVVPVNKDQLEYAHSVAATLRQDRIRVRVVEDDASLSAKVRAAQAQKVPFVLVLGRREEENSLISYRLPSGQQRNGVELDKFREHVRGLVATKAFSVE